MSEDHKVDSTGYLNAFGEKDLIYVFYYPDDHGNPINPSLQAKIDTLPSDSLFNFEWLYYNENTLDFDSVVANFTGVNSSSIDSVNSGGYRVLITNEYTVDTVVYTIWFNKQLMRLFKVALIESACDNITLEAEVNFQDTFRYYNPLNDSAIFIKNEIKYSWAKYDDTIPESGKRISIDPPTDEILYKCKITDIYNTAKTADYHIDAVTEDNNQLVLRAVKASFSAKSLSDKSEHLDTIRIEAPRGIMFYNESSPTGELFNWYFHNNDEWIKKTGEKYFATSTLENPVDSIYYKNIPYVENSDGLLYDVTLKAYGPVYKIVDGVEYRCMDSITNYSDFDSVFVVVEPPFFPENNDKVAIEMPNVFTPFDGGFNDYFYFKSDKKPKSIKYFSIKIYNRWGNKIYQYEDEDGSWNKDGNKNPGWDGVTRFGRKVKPGVYYYSAKALGWDDQEFESYGFFHVFYK